MTTTSSNDNVQQQPETDVIGDAIYTGTLVISVIGVVGFLASGLRGLFPAPVTAVLEQLGLGWILSIAMISGIAWAVTSIVIGLRRECQTDGGDQ